MPKTTTSSPIMPLKYEVSGSDMNVLAEIRVMKYGDDLRYEMSLYYGALRALVERLPAGLEVIRLGAIEEH